MNEIEKFKEWTSALALGMLSKEELALKTGFDSAEHRQLRVELRRVHFALAQTPSETSLPNGLKDRILSSVQQAEAGLAAGFGFAFVRADEGAWRELAPGARAKSLFATTDHDISTMLVRMLPGSTIPGHRHDVVEELLLLEGDCYCAGQCLHAGDYHRAEGGSVHGDTFTERGCLMIIHTSRPAPIPS
jgi:quercetin dioxygenase-like cupin family protein